MIEPDEKTYKFDNGFEVTTLVVHRDTIEITDDTDKIVAQYKKIVKITDKFAIIQLDDDNCMVIKSYMILIPQGDIVDLIDDYWITSDKCVIIFDRDDDERYGCDYYTVKMQGNETVIDAVLRFSGDIPDLTVSYYDHDGSTETEDNYITKTDCNFINICNILNEEDYVTVEYKSEKLGSNINYIGEKFGYTCNYIPEIGEWIDYCALDYFDLEEPK